MGLFAFYVGNFAAGDVFGLSLQGQDSVFDAGTPDVHTLNEGQLRERLAQIKEREMKIIDYSTSHVLGVVDAEKKELMLTTIPYDEGWTLTIDGKEAELLPTLEDTFLSFWFRRAGNHPADLLAQRILPGRHHLERDGGGAAAGMAAASGDAAEAAAAGSATKRAARSIGSIIISPMKTPPCSHKEQGGYDFIIDFSGASRDTRSRR